MMSTALLISLAFTRAAAEGGAQFVSRWHADGTYADASACNATELPLECEVAVVGAGWGGAYLAWRMSVDSNYTSAETICVFEANGRVGGRIYSVHNIPGFDDLALDVGGYRFIETDLLPAQIVWKALKLPTACYDWQCGGGGEGPGNCYIIKDAYGNNAGYATPITEMLGQVEDAGAGTQVFFGKQLTAIAAGVGRGALLAFADGTAVRAKQLFLNLPHNAIQSLDQDSILFTDASAQTCDELDAVTTGGMNKVYVYYEDAWWNSKLGLMEGTFDEATESAPFKGRYHDGPQKCVVGVAPSGAPVYSGEKVARGSCSGALEVYYSSRTTYYAQFTTSPYEALAVVRAGDAIPEGGADLLADVHAHLLAFHADALRDAGVDPEAIAYPTVATVSNWVTDAPVAPGIGHFDGTDEMRKSVRAPTPDFDIFIADQDYGYRSGWAVGSLQMAEKILTAELGIAKPTWLDDDWFEENIAALP